MSEYAGAAPRRKSASIIIPCWNNLRYTKECAEALLRRTKPPFELIFVDNGSTDGTARYLSSITARGDIKVLRNRKNEGFARAINQGMRAAAGEHLVWLNNDVVVGPGWLERLASCAEKSPSIGAAGPLLNPEGNPPPGSRRWTPAHAPKMAAILSLRHHGKTVPLHRLFGCCVLLKRRAMERVGLLDERFGLGLYEDYDYCLRLRQAGFALMMAQDAYVFHHWHKSFPDAENYRLRARKNRDLFIEKWCRLSLHFLEQLEVQPQILEKP